jgi:hypothetical protein
VFPLGAGLFVLGYAMIYSSLSQMATGGQGTGFLKALGVPSSKTLGINVDSLMNDLTTNVQNTNKSLLGKNQGFGFTGSGGLGGMTQLWTSTA